MSGCLLLLFAEFGMPVILSRCAHANDMSEIMDVSLLICREVRTVQSEVLRGGEPLQQLCAKGFADPTMAQIWHLTGCESEADYVRLLMAKAVQDQAMEQIRAAAQELGRTQASSRLNT